MRYWKLFVIVFFIAIIPNTCVNAEEQCIHTNRSFISYYYGACSSWELEGYVDSDTTFFSRYVTLNKSEKITDFRDGVLEIFDKSTDTKRYIYGHTKKYYCADCNEQFLAYELCRFSTWRIGTLDDYCGNTKGFCTESYIYVCDCHRYNEEYPFIKIGTYIFTEMPKSILDVGQVGLNIWKKVKNYTPPYGYNGGKGTYFVKVIKKDDELDVVIDLVKQKNTIYIKRNKTLKYNVFNSSIKSVRITKGKKIVSVKKRGKKYIKVKGVRRGSANIRITKRNGAIIDVQFKVK